MVRKISGKSKAASHQHHNSNFNGGAETKATTKKRHSRHLRRRL